MKFQNNGKSSVSTRYLSYFLTRTLEEIGINESLGKSLFSDFDLNKSEMERAIRENIENKIIDFTSQYKDAEGSRNKTEAILLEKTVKDFGKNKASFKGFNLNRNFLSWSS